MSGFRPLHAALLLIAAAAIAGPVWAVFVFEPPAISLAGVIPDPPKLFRFKTMAEAACRCRRAEHGGPGKDKCWDALDAATDPYEPSHRIMQCGVTGTESMCFGTSDGKQTCFVIDTSSRGECDDEERRIIAAIWPGWGPYYDDPAQQKRAEEADRRAHDAFERGDRLKAPNGDIAGCDG